VTKWLGLHMVRAVTSHKGQVGKEGRRRGRGAKATTVHTSAATLIITVIITDNYAFNWNVLYNELT